MELQVQQTQQVQNNQKLKNVFIRLDPGDNSLHRDQIRVVNVLRGRSKCDSIDAEEKLLARLTKLNCANTTNVEKTLSAINKYISNDAPIVIHLSETTVKKLLDDTHYRSIFEIYSKGDTYLKSRIAWERECFLGLYDSVQSFERPKYGALNYLNSAAGVLAARSYGTWYMKLKPHVRKRITLATGDTSSSRTLGVLDFCNHVISELRDEELALLVQIVNNEIPNAEYPRGSIYREIQIHGTIDLSRDVESIHVPVGEIGSTAYKFEEKFGVPVFEF